MITKEQQEKILEFVAASIRSERIAEQDINLGHFLSWKSRDKAVEIVTSRLKPFLESL